LTTNQLISCAWFYRKFSIPVILSIAVFYVKIFIKLAHGKVVLV